MGIYYRDIPRLEKLGISPSMIDKGSQHVVKYNVPNHVPLFLQTLIMMMRQLINCTQYVSHEKIWDIKQEIFNRDI